MTNTLRPGLPPLPPKMRGLPIDDRGFPVPFFVAWFDGRPDHRVADQAKIPRAIKGNLCWLCGQPLGAFKASVIGPMCAITRTISEPPSHLECARYAAMACPFMTRPAMKRRDAGLPESLVFAAGEGLRRNPGAVCVWVSRRCKPFRHRATAGDGTQSGLLWNLEDPTSTEWYAEGRPATRDEIEESITSGLPRVLAGHEDDTAGRRELQRRLDELRGMLDRTLGAAA